MKKSIFSALIMAITINCTGQEGPSKTISKNKMEIAWHYDGDRVFFEMSAPTDGWVTIGFNTTSGTTGAYLLMGNVVNGKSDVVEHYTISPGNYKTLSSLGEEPQVQNISGNESANGTTLTFSLPIKANCKYQKDLSEGSEYTMLIAYSKEDDFQHHSIMRTSSIIKL